MVQADAIPSSRLRRLRMPLSQRIYAPALRSGKSSFFERFVSGHHSTGAEKSRPILVNSTPNFWIKFNAYSYLNWPSSRAFTCSTCIF